MRACLAMLGILTVAAACGDDGGDGNGNGGSGPLTLATFNTGLSPGFVPYATVRADPVGQALAAVDADVLCLQELVVPSDVQTVESALAADLPEALFFEPLPGEEAVCTLAELAPVVDCALAACGDLTSEALANCVVQSCPDALAGLSVNCTSCLAGQLQSDLDAVVAACTPEGGGVGFEGAFGIGLFTNATVAAEDSLQLDASLSRRGVLYALLEPDEGEPVHVFCTHLTPLLERIPYPGDGSWMQEQGRQVDALLSFVDEKVPEGERVAVLGDLNTGPGGEGWDAQAQAHYQRFLAAGFTNPFADGPEAACTWCADNSLVEDDEASTLIDHVLVRDFAGLPTARRILTEPVELEIDGRTETSNLSDHYGVALTEDAE